MRILFVTDIPDLPERYLLQGIVRAGHQVVLFLNPETPEREQLALAGIECRTLEIRHRFDWNAIRQIRAAIDQFQPDVVHAFTARGLCVVNLALFGRTVPVVAYRGTSGHLSRLDPMSWLGFLSPRVKAISCVSDAVRQYMLGQGIPDAKLWVILYKGHLANWYKAAPRVVWREFDIPSDHLVAVCVANARPVKGVDILLRAALLLRSPTPITIVIVGELRDEKLQRLVDVVGQRVRILGFRKDATALIGAADIVIVPSRDREGLPKAMMEAMAQAVPVIVTRVGGMPEIVRHNIDGVVVPKEDPQAIAREIDRLADDQDLRSELGSAGRRRVTEQFGAEALVQKTIELYSAVTLKSPRC